MVDYIERVKDGAFIDLKDDYDFQVDLVQFFSGGRYTKSREEMKELGYEGLTKEFIEHMRYQSSNEVTAIKDLNYAINKDVHRKGKESFGNLIQAWDNSDRAGTGYLDGASDFLWATASAPSTYVGLGSLGLGKLGAKAAAKGTQMLVRSSLKKAIVQPTLKKAVKPISKTMGALKGAGTGFAAEAAIGGVTAYGGEETREELIEGYDYTTGDLALQAGVQGLFGSVLGGVGGALSANKGLNKLELAQKMSTATEQSRKEAAELALKTIDGANAEQISFATGRVVDLEATLAARGGDAKSSILEPLDSKKVEMGETILKGITDIDNKGGNLSSGLSMDTIRSITAATIDIADELNIKSNERITSAVARRLDDEAIDSSLVIDNLEKIRNKYGLTRQQMSYVYLADVSRAGKILAEQSRIAKATKKAGSTLRSLDEEAAAKAAGVEVDINKLAAHGLSSFDDQAVAEMSSAVVRNSSKRTAGTKFYNFLQDVDQMRIAFMTSQFTTTARNITSTVLLAGVDMSDELFRGMIRGVQGKPNNVLRRMSATVRGMSWDNATAEVFRESFLEQMPEEYTKTFYNTLRMEVGTQSTSRMAKTGRLVNLVNTTFDTAFKEGAMFGSLDKQLADLGDETVGLTVKDFLEKGGRLDDLPDGFMAKSIDDANRFTMQRTYEGDKSPFGKAARGLSSLNQKYPFIISAVVGIPFPRYVANHIEMIADYTPILGAVVPALKKAGVNIGGDAFKSNEDRMVRQLTGTSLIALGYLLASNKEGEVDYGSIETAVGSDADLAPSAGFLIAPMFLGDLMYRNNNGLALPETGKLLRETGAVFGGLGDLGVDFSLMKETAKSFTEGGFTENLQKQLGNIAATFTYPGTLARDIAGQFSYEAAGTPYVRDIEGIGPFENRGAGDATKGEDLPKSMKGERGSFQVLAGQATRFLADTDTVQYTQSFTRNPNNDISYYSPFNSAPIGKMNPLLKQFTGFQQNPPMTGLQREMNKLYVEEYEMYSSRTATNASVDYILRHKLAKSLPQAFEAWRKQAPIKAGNNNTYDELSSDERLGDKANAIKKKALEGFIKNFITEQKEVVTEGFQSIMADRPVEARGFIRNNYTLKRKEIGSEIFDMAANELNSNFSTSEELLADSDSIVEELNRRMAIMDRAKELKADLEQDDFKIVQ
tara:strand:+ start:428 stop:3940 length:3513 start_codon:yes stop_codon:yes gene_type:complete